MTEICKKCKHCKNAVCEYEYDGAQTLVEGKLIHFYEAALMGLRDTDIAECDDFEERGERS